MKLFTIIGIVVVGMWVWHYAGNSIIKPAANTTWNASAPYLNQAVNSAHDKVKKAVN